MKQINTIKVKDSIAAKLLKVVFSFYFFLTVTVTLVHIIAEYQDEKKNIMNDLITIKKTFEPGLATTMWELNVAQMRSTFLGMIKFPSVIGMKIVNNKGHEIGVAGNIINNEGKEICYDLKGKKYACTNNIGLFSLEFPIRYNQEGDIRILGRATIYSSSEIVFDKVKFGFLFIIVNAFIKTVALWVLFLWVSRIYLTRPLSELTAATEQLNLDNLDNLTVNVKTTGRNELKILEDAFNSMVKKLIQAKQTLQSSADELLRKNKALDESEKKYRTIFDNAIEGIFQISSDMRFVSVNKAMVNLLGYSSSQELISSITDIAAQCYVKPDDHVKLYNAVNEKESVSGIEIQYLKKDGTTFWGSESVKVVHQTDEILYYEGSLVDITEKKEKEKAERKREVAELATLAKSEFLANMSHEIRTPMNGIIVAAELAIAQKLEPEAERYLRIVQSSGNSLLGIINDILDFSKIEAGKLSLENVPFDIMNVLENITNLFIHKVEEKGIELLIDIVEYKELVTPVGDSLRLQQIITNLIGNAIKFTEKGGTITIGVYNVESDQVKLKFFVKDTGVGMKPEQIDKIFAPFTQADTSTTRKYGGTGLGLSISKQLVEMMGGEIWVESKLNEGSSFYFTATFDHLPIKADKGAIPYQLKKLNILSVDDNITCRILLEKMLLSYKFEVESVSNGFDALSKLKNNQTLGPPYDLIILDWLMPGLDGLETANKIRSELQLNTPIIMLTGFGQDEIKPEAEKVGVTKYLTKPIMPSTLFDAIIEIFAQETVEPVSIKKKVYGKASNFKERLKGCRILLAEDNLTNQEIAQAVLEGAGITIEIANNGREAVEAVRKSSFDAVLMDIQMPEMDGFQATDTIRKDSRFASLPIIAMTAHAMKGDKEKCLAAGMNGYVTKPINQDELFFNLSEIIKEKKISAEEEAFIKNHAESMKKIWNAYNKQNKDLLQATSHTLMEDAEKIGEKKVKNISKRIELFCIDEKDIDISLIKALENELNVILERM